MKLQDQVCALEQARLLHKMGIAQHGYFFWHLETPHIDKALDLWTIINDQSDVDLYQDVSAFSVAELGAMLPFELLNAACMDTRKVINNSDSSVGIWKYKHLWMIRTIENTRSINFKTEAEARAAMLIYLLENKLLTAEEANQRLMDNE